MVKLLTPQQRDNSPKLVLSSFTKVPLPEMQQLESRQNAILEQLEQLKKLMMTLQSELTPSAATKPTSIHAAAPNSIAADLVADQSKARLVREVVLNASPDHPPYSLLAMHKLWSGTLGVAVSCYTHSSITSLPAHCALFNAIPRCPQAINQLHVVLIWKEVGADCELVVSPLTQPALHGEVNLLRYLDRTLSAMSRDAASDTQLDCLYDACHKMAHCRYNKERLAAIKVLSAALGKGQWLGCGGVMGPADVAAWSAVRSVDKPDLNQTMAKWFQRCDQAAGIAI